MAKGKSSKKAVSPLPLAPVVYLNRAFDYCRFDPEADVAHGLRGLIPKATVTLGPGHTGRSISLKASNDTINIVKDTHSNTAEAAKIATSYHEEAIKVGCNFASVNIYEDELEKSKTVSAWGGNHLELCSLGLTTKEMATKIYKWLFSVYGVAETLHLISEEEMLATDQKSFPAYAYCAIADSRKVRKDAKIQFVALITSKPAPGPDGRLHWAVTDRTGSANFYFQYRGPSSKYTWDWVLALQPGDRKALPRMPMVKVAERKRVTIAKAPFRGVGMLIGGTGAAVRGVGNGLCLLGSKVKMGARTNWVAEADVKEKQKKDTEAVVDGGIKVFNEKGEKTWKDEDDDASTTAGSVNEKEFI